jgi:hypothetical protein
MKDFKRYSYQIHYIIVVWEDYLKRNFVNQK